MSEITEMREKGINVFLVTFLKIRNINPNLPFGNLV